jgi:photosystem II stability/assembly factor-like uncharacterized protein
MQLRRSVLTALMIILFILFESHSCSEDEPVGPEQPAEAGNELLGANDIFFLDADHGWIVGRMGTALVTEDGGESWTPVTIDALDIRGVHFFDDSSGWVVGSEGSLYHSDDGGYSWQNHVFTGLPQEDDLFEVRFINESEGYILGYHGVFVTDDGGIGWTNNWLPIIESRGAWSMSVVDDDHAFLLGSRYNDSDPELLYHTSDGGSRWYPVPGSNASILRGIVTIEFLDTQTGWAGGGAVMKTTDGGHTWTTQLETATVREFFILDESTVFGVGRRAIIHTIDGGGSWIDLAPEDERIVDLRAVHFIDGLRGWVVGKGREEVVDGRSIVRTVLLGTIDGGRTWSVREFSYDITGLGAAAFEDGDPPIPL